MLIDVLFKAFNLLFKIILLPLLIVVACGVLIIPFVPIVLLIQPSLEALFVALVLVGLWPMCAAVSYSAFFIGHFIERSLPNSAEERYDLYTGGSLMYVRLAIEAGDFLASALDDFGEDLDAKTRERGEKLANRHRVIAKYVWPGMAISAVGGIGLALNQVLVPAGPASQADHLEALSYAA